MDVDFNRALVSHRSEIVIARKTGRILEMEIL